MPRRTVKKCFWLIMVSILAAVVPGFSEVPLGEDENLVEIIQRMNLPRIERGVVAVAEKIGAQYDAQGAPEGDKSGPQKDQGGGQGKKQVINKDGEVYAISGSGFVVKNGPDAVYILTNNHVAEEFAEVKHSEDRETYKPVWAKPIWVIFSDGGLSPHIATVAGLDAHGDIALLRVDPRQWEQWHGGRIQEARLRDVPPLELGDSDALKVGQRVIALGHPYGVQDEIMNILLITDTDGFFPKGTRGAVSDGHTNPGNSGGPLLDTSGKVVGINTAILERGAGIGFSISIASVRDVVLPQMLASQNPDPTEKISFGTLGGVALQEISGDLGMFLGLPTQAGAIVTGVPKNSAGFFNGNGLKRGDVIVGVGNEHKVKTPNDIESLIRYAPWDMKKHDSSANDIMSPGSPENAVTIDWIAAEHVDDGTAHEKGKVWRMSLWPQHKTPSALDSASDKLHEYGEPKLLDKPDVDYWGLLLRQAKEGVWVVSDQMRQGAPASTFLREVGYYGSDGKLVHKEIKTQEDVARVAKEGHSELVLVFSRALEYNENSEVTFFYKRPAKLPGNSGNPLASSPKRAP